ncbi:MAG: hypothetical protein ACXVRE_06385 [Gaiellaceae bacterium]
MEAGTPGGRGYGPATTVGAILGTFFFPLLALIAALVMLGNESNPEKRSFLRTWAWVSGFWLVVPVVLLILLANYRI